MEDLNDATTETVTFEEHTFRVTWVGGLFYSFVGTPDSGEFPPREVAISYLAEHHGLAPTPATMIIDEYLRRSGRQSVRAP